MNCQACNIECKKFGKHRNGLQRFRCPQCGKTYTEDHARLFAPMTVPEDKALLAIQLLIEGTRSAQSSASRNCTAIPSSACWCSLASAA